MKAGEQRPRTYCILFHHPGARADQKHPHNGAEGGPPGGSPQEKEDKHEKLVFGCHKHPLKGVVCMCVCVCGWLQRPNFHHKKNLEMALDQERGVINVT